MATQTNYRFVNQTGSAAVAYTLAPAKNFVLVGFKFHGDAVGGAAENLTITVDSASGAAYDLLLYSQDMTAVADITQVYTNPIPFKNGDELDFAYANSNTNTWGLEIIYREEV